MASEREFQEAVARCVAIVVYHQNATHGRGAPAETVAEIATVADSIRRLSSASEHLEQQVVLDVQRELVARYGLDKGMGLNLLVVRAFTESSQVDDEAVAALPKQSA
jgi:hypothetical protein